MSDTDKIAFLRAQRQFILVQRDSAILQRDALTALIQAEALYRQELSKMHEKYGAFDEITLEQEKQ